MRGVTLSEFRRSLAASSSPPAGIAPALLALWWSHKNDWEQAHRIVMAHDGDRNCAWVHAYLHRVEGDLPNAQWWYKQARKPAADGPLDAEWNAIVRNLLEGHET